MRSLTVDEITRLESQACTAQDWGRISVADDFEPDHLSHVTFLGDVALGLFDKEVALGEGVMMHSGISHAVLSDVTVGDNCLIANIAQHIHRYDIGDDCVIIGVGAMTSTEAATFGLGTQIAAPREAGAPNIALYGSLTAQVAAIMTDAADSPELRQRIVRLAMRQANSECPTRGTVGYGVRITNTREVTNTWIGDGCELNGATRLSECTLVASPEAGIYIGADVVMDNCVVQPGASAVDGARLYNCLLGEACHAGRGFTAESSLFFANSYMDNGEACAAVCGPFSVSHHKASLLIGTQTSFYNAGSATNFSNHAYKLGPLHRGSLARGCKTGSGTHIVLPAEIGQFTVCLGKIESHPVTTDFPFSYLIAAPKSPLLIPGRNLLSVGLWRDVAKWPKRDMRPQHQRLTNVSYDWLNPSVVERIIQGKARLEQWLADNPSDGEWLELEGCRVSRKWAAEGVETYDMAIRLYIGQAIEGHFGELPDAIEGIGEWTDVGGIPLPANCYARIKEAVTDSSLDSIEAIDEQFALLASQYAAFKWSFTYNVIVGHYHLDSINADDMQHIEADCAAAKRQWHAALTRDVEREKALGNLDDDATRAVARQLSTD